MRVNAGSSSALATTFGESRLMMDLWEGASFVSFPSVPSKLVRSWIVWIRKVTSACGILTWDGPAARGYYRDRSAELVGFNRSFFLLSVTGWSMGSARERQRISWERGCIQ